MKEESAGTKDPEKVPVAAAKRTSKKKAKDKPKRPLSAYNFFFKEERGKILRIVLSDDESNAENDPNSDEYIDKETIQKLKKDDGKVSFEEMGKLIGLRWKQIDPERLTKYSELAAEDTERYKKDMVSYNGRQEAKMRSEAMKPGAPPPSYGISSQPGLESIRATGGSTYADVLGSSLATAGVTGSGYYGGNLDLQAYAGSMGRTGYNPYASVSAYSGLGLGASQVSQLSQQLGYQGNLMGYSGTGAATAGLIADLQSGGAYSSHTESSSPHGSGYGYGAGGWRGGQ